MKELIERLREAAIEIASEGHAGWGNCCTDAAEVIESLSAQVAELRKDAERYRWLRSHPGQWRIPLNPERLDANIDAAKERK